MRFASLGSGSRGNGTLVEWQHGLLLVDCGFTIKSTEQRLARLGKTAADISAIVVTHEHGDHLKGVAPFARKHNTPVYMTPGTFKSKALGCMPSLHLIEGYQAFELEGLKIQPIAVPHDAREPAQFVFDDGVHKLGILTDLGSITPHVESSFAVCDALVLEANHDPAMLASGPYPPSLKQRVGGLWGHLSNQQTAGLLQRLDVAQLQHLVVAHISQKNNSLEIAKSVLDGVTAEAGNVIYACQEEGFDWLELAEI